MPEPVVAFEKGILMTTDLTLRPDCTDSLTDIPGVLVVDDNPMLLSLLQTALSRRGFLVWTSASGSQAVEVYREQQQQIAVVLLDVRMPGLDGPATLAELRRIHPGLRACFMSGETGKYTPEDLLALGAQRLFDKPFRLLALADELWQIASEEARQTA